jgi:hypothetical protein
LQAFAASVGEPTESEQILTGEAGPVMTENAPLTPSVDAKKSHVMDKAPSNFGTNFISEDDLPEWLRSIAPLDAEADEAELFLLSGDENADQLSVPNVTRAWSTSQDARGVDESTSLFALVASQASQSVMPTAGASTPGLRPQVGERSAANAQAEATGLVGDYGSEMPPDMSAGGMHLPTSAPHSTSSEQSTRVKVPMLPIVVAGILMLVLIVVAIALFVA